MTTGVGRTAKARLGAQRAQVATAKPLRGTAPELVQGVARLLRAGGRGQWFTSVSPFDPEARPDSFFVVKSLPPRADPQSPVLLLQTEPTRAYLAQLVSEGVPLVLGRLPQTTQTFAAAIGTGAKLTEDALAAGHVEEHTAVMLVQPEADKFVVAHELQHWRDYDDGETITAFTAAEKPLARAADLTPEEETFLQHVFLELRGHNAQGLQAVADDQAKEPYLDVRGQVATGSEAHSSYAFQVNQARTIFNEAYAQGIYALLRKLDQAGELEAVGRLFAKFDLSDQPGAPLSFQKFVQVVARSH